MQHILIPFQLILPAVPCTSFGRFIRETYSESYSPLLFWVGGRESRAYDKHFNIKNKLLRKPPENSIEYSLSNSEDNTFYVPLTPDFDKLILSRFKRSHHISQEFYVFNLYQRYKGVFLMRISS